MKSNFFDNSAEAFSAYCAALSDGTLNRPMQLRCTQKFGSPAALTGLFDTAHCAGPLIPKFQGVAPNETC